MSCPILHAFALSHLKTCGAARDVAAADAAQPGDQATRLQRLLFLTDLLVIRCDLHVEPVTGHWSALQAMLAAKGAGHNLVAPAYVTALTAVVDVLASPQSARWTVDACDAAAQIGALLREPCDPPLWLFIEFASGSLFVYRRRQWLLWAEGHGPPEQEASARRDQRALDRRRILVDAARANLTQRNAAARRRSLIAVAVLVPLACGLGWLLWAVTT